MNFDITSLLELLESRKTIRSFTDQTVEDQIVLQILEAARWAPSAMNSQPWEFILVKDKDIIRNVAQCAKHAPTLQKAPLLIAVVKNMQNEDEWLANQLAYEQSVSSAGLLMLLAIHQIGLGGFWANVDRSECARILDLPRSVGDISFVIACGYVDTEHEARLYFKTADEKRRKEISDYTFLNKYGEKNSFTE